MNNKKMTNKEKINYLESLLRQIFYYRTPIGFKIEEYLDKDLRNEIFNELEGSCIDPRDCNVGTDNFCEDCGEYKDNRIL